MANQYSPQSTTARREQFAEYLAEGKSMVEIREIMGLTNGAAQGLMGRIRAGLGDQAR